MNISLDFSNLHDFQKDFLKCDDEFILFSGGSGIGKSKVGTLKLILNSLRYKNYQSFYASSTWSATETIFLPMLLKSLEAIPTDCWHHDKGKQWIEFKNGSIIRYRNLDDPSKYRSTNLDMVMIEEATNLRNIADHHDEFLRGIRNKKGPQQIIYITNPGLKTHWLYKYFYEEKKGTAWSIPARVGTHNEDSYFKRFAMMSESKRKSLELGEWGVMDGMAYTNIIVDTFDDIEQDIKWSISYDCGFSPDPQVYLLIGTINNKVYVRKDISLINVPTSRHNQWLDSWCRDYNIVSATGESGPGSGDTRSMLYENYKLHYTLPNKHRTVGWLKLADLIDQGNLIIHPECTDTLNSLESLSWISGTRGVDVEGPSDHW